MTTDRKKPGVAFWASVVMTIALLYPISFGPACWWLSKEDHGPAPIVDFRRVPSAYWPIGYAALHGPKFLGTAINWYATLGTAWPLLSTWPDESEEAEGIIFIRGGPM